LHFFARMEEEKQGMLFPPLDDDYVKNDSLTKTASSLGSTKQSSEKNAEDERLDCQSSSLPKSLSDRFAHVRALLRKEHADDKAQLELKRKQRHAAFDVAMAMEREVSRIESAIAELESLQQRQHQHQHQHRILIIPHEGGNNQAVDVDSNLDDDHDSIASHHFDEQENDFHRATALPSVIHDEDSL